MKINVILLISAVGCFVAIGTLICSLTHQRLSREKGNTSEQNSDTVYVAEITEEMINDDKEYPLKCAVCGRKVWYVFRIKQQGRPNGAVSPIFEKGGAWRTDEFERALDHIFTRSGGVRPDFGHEAQL